MLAWIALCVPPPASAQRVIVPIEARHGDKVIVDTIGFHWNATYCIDGTIEPGLTEVELPPLPLSIFDVRFVDHRFPGACLGVGVRLHVQEYAKTDTFRMEFQPGDAGYPITFRWPAGLAPHFESLTIGYPGAFPAPLDMLQADSLRVVNPSIGTLEIIGTARQPDDWPPRIPIRFSDSSGFPFSPDTLRFGVHPNATICVDDSLGEYPFITECGLFSVHCAQFGPMGDIPCDPSAFPVFLDLRPLQPGGPTTQVDTYRVGFVGTHPVILHWPDDLAQEYVACRLVDHFSFILGLPPRVDVDMLAVDSAVVSDSSGKFIGDLVIVAAGPWKQWVGVGPPAGTPGGFRLSQNYPNPFNPVTTIEYALPAGAEVRLVVFDLLGREVAVIAEGFQPPGSKKVAFDAAGLPGGVYVCRLTSGDFVAFRKMIVMR